ncbi:uncharacterized protein DDB_G0285291-like isoform X2 [Pectinophora gossypiella]|uniref:uncharacterized protein DDB_G0285291-like isoform X2 n=1 Tax=Pectinophora gossypiella TaxID=13191 RepID=UPI00214F12FB|nr:uncharacterized protein DDB_G0285291-like isoform X2 [Pectinophora gossypiella]
MLKLILLVMLLECGLGQHYQQKVAPGVPPQKYENIQKPPPPPPKPQQQQKLPPGVPPQKYQAQHQQQKAQQQAANQQVPQQQVPQQQVPQQQVPQQQVPQQQVPQQQVPQQQQKVPQKTVQPVYVNQEPKILSEDHMEHEKKHMEMHMDVPVDTADLSKEEMHFRYFKMHDIDKNGKLDGCELIKSLHHWHGEGEAPSELSHVYSDEDLIEIVEGALKQADFNNDGFIDYAEMKRSVIG